MLRAPARRSRARPVARLAGLAIALAAAAVAALAPSPAAAAARSWTIVPGEAQRVGFRSRAPLESFEGVTAGVEGTVLLDPADPATFTIEVRVDLASLDTGIAMRDRHMRENHLDTARFPRATFRADSVVEASAAALPPGESVRLVVAGTLDLHGVPRPREIALDVARLADDQGGPGLRVTAEFPVLLADHDISRPGFLVMKLGEVQTVFVDVVATPTAEP